METAAAAVAGIEQQLTSVLGPAVPALRFDADADLVALASALGAIKRRVEGALVEVAGQLDARTGARADGSASLDHAFGCRNANELLQRCTGDTGARAAAILRASRLVHGGVALTSGDELSPFLPALRTALRDGQLGVDGLLAAGTPLDAVRSRVPAEVLGLVDEILAGRAAESGALLPADALRQHATDIVAHLDQDGPEPTLEEQNATRAFTFGRMTKGLVPVHGKLMPEVASAFKRLMTAIDSPRVRFTDEDPDTTADLLPRDDRTPPQRRHDALATIVHAAAASPDMPEIGGAAPTLVVHVDAEVLRSGVGSAFVPDADADGATVPVHVSAAKHTACTGGITRVTQQAGRIVALDTVARCFNALHRAAIAARDVTCVIPGCQVPAVWCEIHHVDEWRNGGKTHTDNGTLLCWHHHRTIDSGGWRIEMRDGVPWIQAPSWIDASRTWRPHRPPTTVRRP